MRFGISALLIAILPLAASAQTRCESAFPEKRTLIEKMRDHGLYITAELEVDARETRLGARWLGLHHDQVLGMITTENGKVGAIFDKLREDTGVIVDFKPEDLNQFKVTTEEHLRELPFDALTGPQKLAALQIAGLALNKAKTEFSAYRLVPGVRFKENARLHFLEDVTIDGVLYPEGYNDVPAGRWFAPKIEFGNYKRQATFLELHLEMKGMSPASATVTAGQIARAVDQRQKGQHHINVGLPINWSRLAQEKESGALRLTEALIRADMIEQMISVFHDGQNLYDIKNGSYTFWGVRKPKEGAKIFDYFQNRARGIEALLKDEAKLSYVAPRDSNNSQQILAEFRNGGGHSRDAADLASRHLMNNVVESFIDAAAPENTRRFGIEDEAFARWESEKRAELGSADNIARRLIYNDPLAAEHAPAALRDVIEELRQKGRLDLILSENQLQHRWLLYDFSNQPTLYGVTILTGKGPVPLLKHIVKEQRRALQRIKVGENPAAATRDFLRFSQVLNALTDSY